LPLEGRAQLIECVPRALGAKAAAGEVAAGLLPVADFFKLQETFERLGRIGIAVRGRVQSVMLFSLKPMRQLEGANILLTDETSTSAVLLRLLLEKRYKVTPAAYERRQHAEQRHQIAPAARERRQSPEADALLLIGDEALRFQQTNTQYPFETDLAFEWWLWQHLPCVFAVWAVRKTVAAAEKKRIEAALMRALVLNAGQLDAIAEEHAGRLHLPAAELKLYLSRFVYRFGQQEEEGMAKFQELAHEHHLL